MDELEVSSVARSGDWIAAEYNNQKLQSSFFSVSGAATRLPVGAGGLILQ